MSKRRYFVLQATGQPKQFSVYHGGDSQHPITNRKEAEAFVKERSDNVPEGSIIVVQEVSHDEEEAKPASRRANTESSNTASSNTVSANTDTANTAS